mmetsp:Transcript_3216/g.5164  ORF Transcript_3216/g.5164 Transcript_3216/m.5164 type:complete len:80 (+) Transcript_3216:354-593(+)
MPQSSPTKKTLRTYLDMRPQSAGSWSGSRSGSSSKKSTDSLVGVNMWKHSSHADYQPKVLFVWDSKLKHHVPMRKAATP